MLANSCFAIIIRNSRSGCSNTLGFLHSLGVPEFRKLKPWGNHTCNDQNYEVYSKGCGGWGSSSTAMADAELCCPVVEPLAGDAADDGVSVRESTSGSVGCRSLKRTNPEGADFTGTYLLSSINLINFSWAGTTLAGFVKIS